MNLKEKLDQRRATVGVIGLGYVGLPLAMEFARAGFKVIGIDVDPAKPAAIKAGRSYVTDVPSAEVARHARAGRLRATTDFSALRRCDAVSICVPTPLRKSKDPDVSYIAAAVKQVTRYLHRGMLVVLESTTYPGTTREMVLPDLLAARTPPLRVGKDFFLAFSPERVDPGNTRYNTRTTPKIVGGINADAMRIVAITNALGSGNQGLQRPQRATRHEARRARSPICAMSSSGVPAGRSPGNAFRR